MPDPQTEIRPTKVMASSVVAVARVRETVPRDGMCGPVRTGPRIGQMPTCSVDRPARPPADVARRARYPRGMVFCGTGLRGRVGEQFSPPGGPARDFALIARPPQPHDLLHPARAEDGSALCAAPNRLTLRPARPEAAGPRAGQDLTMLASGEMLPAFGNTVAMLLAGSPRCWISTLISTERTSTVGCRSRPW